MKKAILEFDLPEDEESYYLAYHGHDYKYVIDGFMEWVRHQDKYTENKSATWEEIRAKMFEGIEKWGVEW